MKYIHIVWTLIILPPIVYFNGVELYELAQSYFNINDIMSYFLNFVIKQLKSFDVIIKPENIYSVLSIYGPSVRDVGKALYLTFVTWHIASMLIKRE